jgi:hypothetical protein
VIPDHEFRGHTFQAAGVCNFMFEAISGGMTHGPGAGKHSAMSRAPSEPNKQLEAATAPRERWRHASD